MIRGVLLICQLYNTSYDIFYVDKEYMNVFNIILNF